MWRGGGRPYIVKALTSHHERVIKREPRDLVFGNRQGDPLRQSKVLTRVLQPAAREVGLGRLTWHQFRHVHSSLLNDLKIPAKIAQAQLGHANISTTLGIYTHVIDASHRLAIEVVEKKLFGLSDATGRKSTVAPQSTAPVSDSVNWI